MIQSVKSNGSGRQGPPDLTEMFNKLGGGGGPSGKGIVGIAILVALIWGAFSAFYTVQPEERAVIKRFGSVIGITDPGLHFKLPFGVDEVQLVATERVLKQEFGFRTADTRQAGR